MNQENDDAFMRSLGLKPSAHAPQPPAVLMKPPVPLSSQTLRASTPARPASVTPTTPASVLSKHG